MLRHSRRREPTLGLPHPTAFAKLLFPLSCAFIYPWGRSRLPSRNQSRQKPVEGFRQLLPCASDVITLHAPQAASDQIEHKSERKVFFNATVAEKLGLSLGTRSANGVGDEGEGRGGAATRSRGSVSFDVSVLCTAFHDLHALLNAGHHGFDSRLVGPLLWNVNVSWASRRM